MTNIYGYIAGVLLLIAFGFGAGWQINGWRQGGKLADEKAAHAADLKAVSDTAAKAAVEYQQKQSADLKRIAEISDQYQGVLNRAKSENDDLLARLNAGTTRLYVAAHCPSAGGNQTVSPAAASSGINATSAELDASARSAYQTLVEGIRQMTAQIEGLQEYARTVSQ